MQRCHFRWGRAGVPMVENFAARETGPDTVHVSAEALRVGLASNGQYLLWTVLAEKDTVAPDYHWPDDGQPVLRSYSASYLFDGAQIRLLDAHARTLHARGGTSNATAWRLPPDIPV
jgi:hypothetical protein